MSIRVMTAIWETCLYSGSTLVVLLALADWANDEGGRVFPSLDTLAGKARLSVRGAQLCLRRLQKDGVIRPIGRTNGGRGKVTEYKINLERVNHLQGIHRGSLEGCNRCNKRCNAVAIKGELKAQKGEETSAHIDKHQEPLVDPSHSIGTTDSEWTTLWQEFKSWPGLPVGASERRAKKAWQRLRDELPPDIKERIVAHGAALEVENAARGSAGRALVAHPHNWLERDRGWHRYGNLLRPAECEKNARMSWNGEAGKLIDLIGVRKFNSWFPDAQFKAGPPVIISVQKVFRRNYIEAHFLGDLNRAYGEVVLQVEIQTGATS
jgi:hypothetical protein